MKTSSQSLINGISTAETHLTAKIHLNAVEADGAHGSEFKIVSCALSDCELDIEDAILGRRLRTSFVSISYVIVYVAAVSSNRVGLRLQSQRINLQSQFNSTSFNTSFCFNQ